MMSAVPLIRLVFVDGIFEISRSDLTAMPKEAKWALSSAKFSLHLPAHAQLYLVEEQLGFSPQPKQTVTHAEIILSEGASLSYLKWQNLPALMQHEGYLQVIQGAGSEFSGGFFSKGAAFEHQKTHIEQQGIHAGAKLYGLCQPDVDHQHLEQSVDVLHAAPYGRSQMEFRGILDAKSKASFRGRVKVPESAPGVQAHQANHYLLLSPEAEARSLPELEIYQHEIQCSHGATVGQLDDAALFYLRSRGVRQSVAKKMLRDAFVSDIFQRVPSPLVVWLRHEMGYDDAL